MTPEAIVERDCDRLAEAYGYRVVRLSQRRGSRVHIGLPDRRYQGKRGAVFIEIKPDTGKLSAPQLAFLEAELAAGCLATVGGVKELGDVLSALVKAPATALTVCKAHVAEWAARGIRREAA
jgi:hypothetical protein